MYRYLFAKLPDRPIILLRARAGRLPFACRIDWPPPRPPALCPEADHLGGTHGLHDLWLQVAGSPGRQWQERSRREESEGAFSSGSFPSQNLKPSFLSLSGLGVVTAPLPP